MARAKHSVEQKLEALQMLAFEMYAIQEVAETRWVFQIVDKPSFQS